jgi:hypothetical protein
MSSKCHNPNPNHNFVSAKGSTRIKNGISSHIQGRDLLIKPTPTLIKPTFSDAFPTHFLDGILCGILHQSISPVTQLVMFIRGLFFGACTQLIGLKFTYFSDVSAVIYFFIGWVLNTSLTSVVLS